MHTTFAARVVLTPISNQVSNIGEFHAAVFAVNFITCHARSFLRFDKILRHFRYFCQVLQAILTFFETFYPIYHSMIDQCGII
jgi:hypothetical protein